MAAGLGFKTFTTGEVLTAADVNGYLMQGVNVFANAAARTAAITSPQEGQMSYLKDTNSTEYYSGSAWVAVAGASGGMTLLSTTTLSGATTTVSGISGSYKDLQIVVFGMTNNTANGIFRIAPNGTTNISSWAMACNQDPTVLPRTNGYIDSFSTLARTSTENTVVINIFNYADTNKNKAFSGVIHVEESGPTIQGGTIGGIIRTQSAITSLVFSNSGGNQTAGTVLIYGVK